MPPCVDVYVWIQANDRASALATFIDRYVDTGNPGDPRFDALVRVVVDERPAPGDDDALADLRRDADSINAFSIYLRAKSHYEAIVTVTEEGGLVLGLGIDDPLNDPKVAVEAADLMADLKNEFHAVSGLAGVELAPPQSAPEWKEAELATPRDATSEASRATSGRGRADPSARP
ncbi:hypothetical protein [Cellulomonas rhizosphaerae]|uniref:Uncharacterized protein n=1 Tax=Cellulomonas rhizosphaerae TaxID=2293719 RepID=A0A413RQG4_9CELL|nr:hypothetical protein [Cellulomonas rhizosphaerae]RHA44161.1 hypothetical protein D1825_02700 [Cellulomonas rhizosphaerae]